MCSLYWAAKMIPSFLIRVAQECMWRDNTQGTMNFTLPKYTTLSSFFSTCQFSPSFDFSFPCPNMQGQIKRKSADPRSEFIQLTKSSFLFQLFLLSLIKVEVFLWLPKGLVQRWSLIPFSLSRLYIYHDLCKNTDKM